MTEALRDFLVEVGFLHNTSEQAKVEAAVKSTEDKITGTVSEGLKRRLELERQSAEDRKKAAAEVGEALYKMVMGLSAKTEKVEVDTGDRAEKRDVDAAKRAAARRAEQIKQAEATFLQISRLATNLSGVITGAIASAPFGSFLMGVERTASSMSRLAVQSKIVGTSVREIDKYRSAMKQAGVDEGEAMGVLNSFSSKMKDNPEVYRQSLERLHVRTLGPDGKPLSYAEMLENFGGHLATLQPYQARIQAGQFGVNSDAALNAIMDSGTFRKNLDAEDDRMKRLGLDPDKVAFQARRVEQEYDRMQDNLRLINTKVQSEFFLPMMEGFNKFADWLEAHPEETKKFEQGLVAFAGVVSLKVIPQLLKLTSALTGLSAMKPPTWLLAMLGVEGAKMLSENTVSNVDSWKDESAAEFYTRAADPGLADRIYGKRGEQQLHGPHHGLGTHAQPHDDRNLWQRTMPKALGGRDAPEGAAPKLSPTERLRRAARGPRAGGDATHVDPNGPQAAGRPNANMTPDNAASIVSAARDLGTTPEDLATVIGYETAGTYSPSKWGGKNGNYMGLIQFGPDERRQYGANDQQSFGEQMGAVVRYLKGRGFKPGMGLLDLYSTINAGSPGHYGVSDGNGTVRSHVARMQAEHAARARAFVALAPGAPAPSATPAAAPIGDQAALDAQNRIAAGKARAGDRDLIEEHRRQQNTPTARAFHPDDDRASRARTGDVPYGARDHLSPLQATHARPANPLADLLKDGFMKVQVVKPLPGMEDAKTLHENILRAHSEGWGSPRLSHRAMLGTYSHTVRHGDHNERHGDTFHVHARTAEEGMRAAERASARRGGKDGIRNGSSSQQ